MTGILSDRDVVIKHDKINDLGTETSTEKRLNSSLYVRHNTRVTL